MISPNTTPRSHSSALPVDPMTLSLMTSPTIFPQVLAFATPSTLAACLRVSQSVAHMAASFLYRDINLIHILPPAISTPPLNPDTRSPFLAHVRTLRLPPHLLYDPALCKPIITAMHRLHTVVVPGDWQGWILCPKVKSPVFAAASAASPRPLRVVIKGLKSPAGMINHGLVQSDLLEQAHGVILCVDYINPVYHGPRHTLTGAVMEGQRLSSDLPEGVKKLTIVLPKRSEARGRGSRLPAGFDMGADSGFFTTPHGSGVPSMDTGYGLGLRDHDSEPDAAPDLGRVLGGRKEGCEVVIVVDVPEKEAESDSGGDRLQELKERTEDSNGRRDGGQGSEAELAETRGLVSWVRASVWEGRDELADILAK